jgi:undecaprenyl-diphosphatase
LDLNGSIFDAINDLAGHVTVADDLMKFAAQYVIFAVFAMVAASWFVRAGSDQSRRLAVYTAVITGALSFVAITVVHHFYTHPRPFVSRGDVVLLIKHSADSSFPSDHATAAFALAASIAIYRRRYGLLLLALAALISFARVYVGLHYPFDVLAGATIGITIALAVGEARPLLEWLDRVVVLRIVPAPLR